MELVSMYYATSSSSHVTRDQQQQKQRHYQVKQPILSVRVCSLRESEDSEAIAIT